MKKIITSVALGLLSIAPLAAEDYPIDLLLRDLGYTESIITVDTAIAVKKSNADAKKYYATKKLDDVSNKKAHSSVGTSNGMTIDDMLKPRINADIESSDMIPALLRYHKENPKSEKITRKLAATTYSVGQYKESLYWYTLTYQRDRSDFEALWNMACIADSIGEKDQARVYLKQYVKVDPNSAWGRMAKDILNNGYQSSNMVDSFDDSIAKFLDSSSSDTSDNRRTAGAVNTSNSTGSDGMIVVAGDKYELESFVASYKNKQNFTEASKDSDALKGNKKSATKKTTSTSAPKTSLANAKISSPAEVNNKQETKPVVETSKPIETKSADPEFDPSITATAEPLGD